MEMGRSASSGGGKVVTFIDDAVAAGRLRNGSLSTYLDVGNKDVVVARPLPTHGMGCRRRTYADGELDVFTAESYFNGAMDGHDGGGHKEVLFTDAAAAPLPVATTAVVVAKPPSSTRASTASVAASSASSANSQTVLYRGRRGSRDKKCCVQVGVLMRTCSGKRAVRVDDGCSSATTKEGHGGASGEPAAASRIDWYRELRMQKAALGVGLPGDGDNSHGGLPPSLNLGTAKVAAIGLTRDEKAGPELTCSSSVKTSFAIVAPVVRATTVPATGRVGDAVEAAKCGNDDDDDDAGSESSSDLFEIKSLMIEDCPYEPSEASVQWSVVTASAASERGDHRVPAARRASGGGGGGRGPVAGRQQCRDHRPVGLLAGCASHRAVEVSAAARKAVPPNAAAAMQRRGDGFQKARNGT